jgi:hypothetical protein
MLVSTPLVALVWLALLSRDHDNKKKFWLEALTTFGQGLAAVAVALVLIIGVDALAIYALLQLKPLVSITE